MSIRKWLKKRETKRKAAYDARLAASTKAGRENIFGLTASGGPYDKGTANLLELLNNPGQTDYNMYNRGVRGIASGTASAMDASRARFASRGLGGSGLAEAFQGAIQGAGADRLQAAREDEASRREQLRRGDLGLLKSFVQDPNIQQYGIDRGISVQQGAQKDQRNAATAGAAAGLIGTLASAFCHTADAIYGIGSQGATLARWYMLKHADPETYEMYAKGSRDLAARVKADPELRAKVKPIFDEFVEIARGDFPLAFE